jgi:hypothetical protein
MEGYLNLFALTFEIIGASLLYKYGFPPHLKEILPGAWVGIGNIDVNKIHKDIDIYKRWNKLGFRFMIIGFLLSFFSIFITIYGNYYKEPNCKCKRNQIEIKY